MPFTYQSIVINVPIQTVWTRFQNFHDLAWAKNVITQVTKVGELDGHQVGAKRIINNAFHETLLEIDEEKYDLKYLIDDGPSPISKAEVSNYIGHVALKPITEGGGTFVEWSSSWESSSSKAVEFCHGIYVALLKDLAASFLVK